MTLVENDKPRTVVMTGGWALLLDERQYERDTGPCVDAARSGQVMLVTDMASETRWGSYGQVASESGCRSSLSTPLPLLQQVTGALNICSSHLDSFDEDSVALAARVASYAATPIVNAHVYTDATRPAAQLQEAMLSRGTIDQAKGILMERHKITGDAAFTLLRLTSQKLNIKLRDVAQHLVTTGSLTDGLIQGNPGPGSTPRP